MNREEILYWANKYDNDHPWWKQTERELGDKLRKTRELTKDDLIRIVEWKFKDLPWLNKRVKSVSTNDDTEVRRISSDVFNSSSDVSHKMDSLQNLDGVGGAIASTVLTFYNPMDYGVFDKHVWRELFGKERKNQYLWTTENYLKVLNELERMAKQHNLDVRTVEKAYFKKNYDESNQK
jgi:thermostable 8-oxoguanine DNA glycosylase